MTGYQSTVTASNLILRHTNTLPVLGVGTE